MQRHEELVLAAKDLEADICDEDTYKAPDERHFDAKPQ
jgi:hypothetical protein